MNNPGPVLAIARPCFRTRIRTRALVLLLSTAGCGALNPSFVQMFNPDASTLDNAPGHLVIGLVNNAEVDERLIAYLESAQGGSLMLSDAEKQQLRPRIRFRVEVTYRDGQTALIEFVNGSANLVQPGFEAEAEADLSQNDLDNVVVICDVALVQIVPPIEVFIPVELTTFEFEEPTDANPGVFRETGTIDPQFTELLEDEVDEDGNTTLRRNFGIRDGPAPAENPLCGSVITIVLDGTLSVPFFQDVPGFDVADAESAASVGGRYEFRISLQ